MRDYRFATLQARSGTVGKVGFAVGRPAIGTKTKKESML